MTLGVQAYMPKKTGLMGYADCYCHFRNIVYNDEHDWQPRRCYNMIDYIFMDIGYITKIAIIGRM